MSPIISELLHGLESAATSTTETVPVISNHNYTDIWGTLERIYGGGTTPKTQHKPDQDFNHSSHRK